MVDVLYEDNQVIVVLKPQNVPSQPDASGDEDMLSMVKAYVKEKYNKTGEAFIGLVHRLDRPTGGVMVFARNSKSASRLSTQMKEGEFDKQYLAVLEGVPKMKTDHLVHYLKKDEKNNIVAIVPMSEQGAKKAELTYNVLAETEGLSLAKVKIFTGRSHQIRVQLASIGCPIFGDVKYGKSKGGDYLALWAGELSFTHPTTKENMVFKVYPPEDLRPWNNFNFSKVF